MLSASTCCLGADMASESLPCSCCRRNTLFSVHPSLTSSAKAGFALASTSAEKASAQKAKPGSPSTVTSPVPELSEVTLEISIPLSEFIPEAKKNQQLLLTASSSATESTYESAQAPEKEKKKEEKLKSSFCKRYLIENASCSPAVPHHSQTLPSLFHNQHLLGMQDSVSKASITDSELTQTAVRKKRSSGESKFLPRPLLFLICQGNVDDTHQLRFDDLPITRFVVLHQNLVCAFGTNRQYQPASRLQFIQQLARRETRISRAEKRQQK